MSFAQTVSLTFPAFSPSRYQPATRWMIGTLGFAVLLAGCSLLYRLTGDAVRFPVNEVEVLGTLDYTDRDGLRELVVEQTRNGFYRLNIDAIRRNVVKLPWVAEAHVRRVWPDRLSIDVVEHEPTARWNDTALISKRFELFNPPQLAQDNVQRAEWLVFFSRFPQLEGSPGRHESVLSNYRTMQVYLQPYAVGIDALIEDSRRSQTVHLDNNVSVRLGVHDIEERMQRFIDIYQRLVEPLEGRAASFDMRYTNGFALAFGEVR